MGFLKRAILRKDVILSVPSKEHFAGSVGEDSSEMSVVRAKCPICTVQFHSGNICALPCGHTFHHQCVARWIQNSKSCPICRCKTQERNVIKQLFFDNADETFDDGNQEGGMDYAAKTEELSLELQKVKDEHSTAQEELISLKKQCDSLADKLEREKQKLAKKLPALESKNRHLEMMLQDQQALEREHEVTKARLRACEFYKLVIRGRGDEAEKAIDKYVNKSGDPESASFLTLLKRQQEDTLKQKCKMDADIKSYIKQLKEHEKREAELKNLIQALKAEADELRLAANKSTPYNPKLRAVFDRSPTKRASLGFNQSLNIDDDLIESAFKRPVPQAAVIRMSKPDSEGNVDLGHLDTFECGSSQKKVENDRIPFPRLDDTLDDSFDLKIPKNVMKRVMAGSPLKKTNAMGTVPTAAVRQLENSIASGSSNLAPRPVKKFRKVDSKKEVGKGARISSFFARTQSGSSLNSNEDVINIE